MKQRLKSVEDWANKVKKCNWKSIHTEFIDSQFKKAEIFIKKLSKEKNGAEKIMKIYGIKNKKGYPNLLNKRDKNI